MSEESRVRKIVAEEIAAAYATHLGVQAIILGGSVARDRASASSDIDLGIFWSDLGSERERAGLLTKISGELLRTVDNSERYSLRSPRRQGLIEIIKVKPSAPGRFTRTWIVDLEHETVAGTEHVLSDVVGKLDTSLDMQELMSVIHRGIALHGHSIVRKWREHGVYTDEFMREAVSESLLGIGKELRKAKNWGEHEEWFLLQESLLKAGRRVILSLMALNREWCYTDNLNFKGIAGFVSQLAVQPQDFMSRLGEVFQSDFRAAISNCAQLSKDVLNLAAEQLFDIRLDAEIEDLQELTLTLGSQERRWKRLRRR